MASAKGLAFFAIKLLVQDIKNLIAKHVWQQIKEGLTNADHNIHRHASEKKRMLVSWEKDQFPLTWNSANAQKGSYNKLLVILNKDTTKPMLPSLQHSSQQLSYNELAALLVKLAKSSSVVGRAPITSKGFFISALPMAYQKMKHLTPDHITEETFATEIFATMLKKMEIHFLPWHCNQTGRSGPSPSKVDPEWWMTIDHTKGPSTVQTQQSVAESSRAVALEVAAANISATWSIPAKLHQMRDLWKKTCRPDDWNIAHASLQDAAMEESSKYVAATYEYVDDIFDCSKWQHHMALIWAILFSRVAPNIAYRKLTSKPQKGSESMITKAIRDMPWVMPESKNRKGIKSPKPFVTMVSTTIIAVRDPNSPLYKEAEKRNGFGKEWSLKHSKFDSCNVTLNDLIDKW